MSSEKRGFETIRRLQEFSVPLIVGVFFALLVANINAELYSRLVHAPAPELLASLFEARAHAGQVAQHGPHAGPDVESHHGQAPASDHASHGQVESHDDHEAHSGHSILSLSFLVNDIFMVLFFGIAAKEITEACLPGGALNPVSKAINPLFGTLGGVLGPVSVFLLLNFVIGDPGWTKGWGIPTATDIALAWLVARIVFGKGHPAISFLLLLAIADDAIGLGIIALAYPDPHHPVVWANTWWILPGMVLALALRVKGVSAWWPYVVFGGALSWWGLYSAHLHPALALVFIVPFLPGPQRDLGLYMNKAVPEPGHSPLEKFEHDLKMLVDFGLFFFAFANAGVPFSGISNLTWIVLASLVVGKTVGITAFSWLGIKVGFPLPKGMDMPHLVVTGLIAGLGLTVALFVSSQAFTTADLQGAAKMGALLSAGVAIAAFVLGQALGVSPASSLALPAWVRGLAVFRRQSRAGA